MMQTVALADVPPTTWKNGGGVTRDLLLWPTAADWLLRISVAEVAQGGPFSAYPGIARWFAVLQGEGVVLQLADGPVRLTPDSAPLHFDGAQAPGCTLLGGPTLDLNLMARQDAGRAELQRAVAGVPWAGTAPLRAVFTLCAATLHGAGAVPLPLPPGTFAFDRAAEPGAPWTLQGDTTSAWWLAFDTHGR